MKDTVLDDIKKYAVNKLRCEHGYCGCADADDFCFLNSGPAGEEVTIKIQVIRDEDE